LGAARIDFFARKYRHIGIHQQMKAVMRGGKTMEIFIPLGFLITWFILQAWVLPRFGVKT
jgi:hypothetical protein